MMDYDSVLASDLPMLKRVSKVTDPVVHAHSPGGYIVTLQINSNRVVLRSQREKVRVFKQVSTALKVITELGFDSCRIEFRPFSLEVETFTYEQMMAKAELLLPRIKPKHKASPVARDSETVQAHNAEIARKKAAKAKRKKSKR